MKTKKLITKLKINAYKLKSGGQIPPLLFSEICAINEDSEESYVRALMQLTEQLIRIKGFYFRYHESELGIDKIIQEFKETQKGKV